MTYYLYCVNGIDSGRSLYIVAQIVSDASQKLYVFSVFITLYIFINGFINQRQIVTISIPTAETINVHKTFGQGEPFTLSLDYSLKRKTI